MHKVYSCSDTDMPKLLLDSGHTLLVTGPASLTLAGGEATVLGARVEQEEKIVVGEERQLALEAETSCTLEATFGDHAKHIEIKGSTIPESWREAEETVLGLENPKVIILGSVDSGKTSLCTYLSNALMKEKSNVTILDADLGQADIGPPATLSLAVADEALLSLSDLDPEIMFFVGQTSPAYAEASVIEGLQKLIEQDPRSDFPLVVNTDGWIGTSESDAFKARMISTIDPDLVIAIERQNGELNDLISKTRTKSITVKTPENVRIRTRDERKRLRELNYRRFLQGGIIRNVNFRRVSLRGLQLRDDRLRGAIEKLNALVGLLDERGLLLNIGILRTVCQREGYMKILTAFEKEPFAVKFGSVKIDNEGRELPLE